jgi:hypothetical protein
VKPLALVAAVALLVLAAGCQSSPAPSAAPAQAAKAAPPPPSPTFQPGPGIECDRRSKVCKYGDIPSPTLTRFYLDDGAARALTAPPAVDPVTGVAPPARTFVDPIFKPSAKSSCDILVVACYDINGANVSLTQKHFGDRAARALADRDAKPVEGRRVLRYGDTITCDQLSQVCYDRLGAGYGITLLYMGEPQAQKLMARLEASPQP